ncbi:SHOCT domain-containing protein [Candidatus Falkowbacteria bacterium]|nr:SHOCT domain-containing protein [Candidatus Falkowbacteria bacterium]
MFGYGYQPFGFIGSFFMLFWWVIIIVAIVALVKWLVSNPGDIRQGPRDDSAMAILKERYAKGEINKEEFENKKKDLMN